MQETDYLTLTTTAGKIAYKSYLADSSSPTIIFLHGYNSDKEGGKAIHLLDYCKKHNYNYIAFDNLGHGDSSGELSEQTIGDMKLAVLEVINVLSPGNNILVGSSIGGWLGLLLAKEKKNLVTAVITIAAACDFTENLILGNMTEEQKQDFKNKGKKRVFGNNPENSYYMDYKFIEEARNHLLLNAEKIDITQPVQLLHGTEDKDIPYHYSLQIMQKLKSERVNCKILKAAGHSLSSPSNLQVLENSIEEIIFELESTAFI